MAQLFATLVVAILTVPTTLEPTTREHFHGLNDWRIETQGTQRVVVNRRRDGMTSCMRAPLLQEPGAYGAAYPAALGTSRPTAAAVRAGMRQRAIRVRQVQTAGPPIFS